MWLAIDKLGIMEKNKEIDYQKKIQHMEIKDKENKKVLKESNKVKR